MAASVIAATSAFLPTASAISSMHSMLISVESMSKAMALKSDSFSGGVNRWMSRPGAKVWTVMWQVPGRKLRQKKKGAWIISGSPI